MTQVYFDKEVNGFRLNPYCNGRKNRIGQNYIQTGQVKGVLILIVMEERIGWKFSKVLRNLSLVLILIVMEERIGYELEEHSNSAYCQVLILIVMEERIGLLVLLFIARTNMLS